MLLYKRKIIIFEELLRWHFFIVWWHLILCHDVYYLRINNRCGKKFFWETGYLALYFLKKLGIELSIFSGFYFDEAFRNVDKFYEIYKNNKILIDIEKLYDNPKTRLAYQKALNERLARFYYLNHVFNAFGKLYPGKEIIFLPSNGIEGCRTDGCEINDYKRLYKQADSVKANYYCTDFVKFSVSSVMLSCFNCIKRLVRTSSKVAMFGFWLLVRCIRQSRGNINAGRTYKHAFTIISPERQFSNKVQKVDFLIDGETIKKEESIFLAPKKLENNGKRYLESNGLNYLGNLGVFVSSREIRMILPRYLFIFSRCLREDILVLETGLKAVYFFAVWDSLLHNVKLEKLITYCDYEVKGIFRNMILENYGCVVYQYMDSINLGCFFAKEGSNDRCASLLGFLYGDYFISWNDMASEFFKHLHCDFKNYANLGCFWSEHIRLIQEGIIESDFKDILHDNGYTDTMKVVSVFDTGLHDDAINSYADGIEFLNGIKKLLDNFAGIFVVLKEKKSRDYHRNFTGQYGAISAAYEELERHPRCYCVKEWRSSSEVIALSDLVISFPFTSATFEAVSACKKGVWFDPADKFRDTFYDAIQGLVCHDYHELSARVDELLYKMADVEYDRYLDKDIRGKVESYLDGMAISRFRDLLSGSFSSFNELNDRSGSALDGGQRSLN